MPDESTDTQETRPKKGDAMEIPVPSKSQIMDDFERIATTTGKSVGELVQSDPGSGHEQQSNNGVALANEDADSEQSD